MEKIIHLTVEKLPEGVYLATSEDIQGLVAQGRTIEETLEIARDVAKKLIEAQETEQIVNHLDDPGDILVMPLVVGA
jgi:predicted RNase H-like HicB family nuclease